MVDGLRNERGARIRKFFKSRDEASEWLRRWSAFIYSEPVPIFRERKSARQIIFVTHNANLPVNADADLVYALRFENGKGVRLAQGGLDRPEVGHAVLLTVEGSR